MIQKNKDESFNGRTSVSKTDDLSPILNSSAMKVKEKKKEKQRVLDLADKWLPILNLYHWKITFSFKDTKEDIECVYRPGDLKVIDGTWELAMSTQVDPYYLSATISVWLLTTREMEDDELEETFLHECSHIMVSPMSKPSKSKEEELVATTFARAIKNTFDISSSIKHGSRNINSRGSIRKGK